MDRNLIVAINAGHYLGNPKGVPSSMPILGGTLEWTLNKKVVDAFVQVTKNYPITVVLNFDTTGVSGGADNQLAARVKTAENAKADIYLSIHHNGGINGGYGGGTTVYCYNNASNIAQAKRMRNFIAARTGLKGNRSNPVVANTTYYECYKPTMPSYIVECAFMDSKTDIYYIAAEDWATKVANGLLDLLIADYGIQPNETAATESTLKYKVKENTPILKTVPTSFIQASGTYTITEVDGDYGKLKSGAGWIDLTKAERIS